MFHRTKFEHIPETGCIDCCCCTLAVDVVDSGESSTVVLSKSEISEAPFEVLPDSGQISSTADSQPPSSIPMSWYQSTSLVGPASNQVRPQRPLQEIVSSMQGNYNFLQDSEIDGKYAVFLLLYYCIPFLHTFELGWSHHACTVDDCSHSSNL